jgi:hypothetical protein
MPHRSLFASSLGLAGVVAVIATLACSGSSPRDPSYPRRAPGCALQISNGLPEMKLYEDIGPVQVDCYLDESEVACLGRLHTEACRMGGDIVYNVPKKALRPVERGMVYRARVAHTRDANRDGKKADDAPAAPPPADGGPAPVEPLLPAANKPGAPPAADGGGQ